MAKQKIKTATDQRDFTLVYNDFLESEVLNYYEKIIFICIKKFANNKTLQAFPSIRTLHRMSGISKSKVQEIIASLESKGVLKIEHRQTKERGHQSNIYTLYDFAELWSIGADEESKAVIDNFEEKRMIDLLKAKGYTVTKEKELESATDQSTDTSTQLVPNQFDIVKNTSNYADSQDEKLEKYSLSDIKTMFDYDIMVSDSRYSSYKEDIDSVMDILYDVFNTTKPTIRIGAEDKPTMVVIGRMSKLWIETIIYSIDKFREQTDRIHNPIAYLTTILYNAPSQSNLDVMNQVQHDMAHWNE